MKRNVLNIVAAVMLALLLVSCGGSKAAKDEYNCYKDFDEAKAAAKKENKEILLIVTIKGEDLLSADFIDNVMANNDFAEKIVKKYAVVHYDFSQESYLKTQAGENATEEEIKQAKERYDMFQKGYGFANLLKCQSAPSIYRFTKDGFLISEVEYDEPNFTIDSFVELIAKYDEASNELAAKIKDVKTGSAIEKVQKIDDLYTASSEKQKLFFADLMDEGIKLDKENESGLMSKFIVVSADLKATKFCADRNFPEAARTYVTICDQPFVSLDDKINGYFMGAYILGMTKDPAQVPQILTWIEKAKELDPEGPGVETLDSMYEYFKAILEEAGLTQVQSE